MTKDYIRRTNPDDNNGLEFGTGYVKRQFLQNTDLLRAVLKEPWQTRILGVSLLMDPKVKKNFLRASKRRQKLMIEHMRGFMVMYHMGSGKIAPCTQGHNGPYRHREVLLIEEFYPTTLFEPSSMEKYYFPKEGDVTLKMRFNEPGKKPEIIPLTMSEIKRVMGIDPSVSGEPDVIWIDHAHPVKTVKNITVQKGVDGKVVAVIDQEDGSTDMVAKTQGGYVVLTDVRKIPDPQREDLADQNISITFTGGPQLIPKGLSESTKELLMGLSRKGPDSGMPVMGEITRIVEWEDDCFEDSAVNADPEQPTKKPYIVFGNELKSTLGWTGGKEKPDLEFLPGSVGNPEFDIFLTRKDLHPAVAEALDKHRAELDKLITDYPVLYTFNPSFSIRAPQQPNTMTDDADIVFTDLLNPIKE